MKDNEKIQNMGNLGGGIRAVYRRLVPLSIRKPVSKIRQGIGSFIPKSELHFTIQLTQHCNLNCAGCFSMCPIAEPEFADFEETSRDIARLAELFNGHAKYIELTGGEPLLHPDLPRFMKMVRKSFPDTHIRIITNGIKLMEEPEEFWVACRENNIAVRPSGYPIKLDLQGIEERARHYQVDYQQFVQEGRNVFSKFAYDTEGRQNKIWRFARCEKCTQLTHGRITLCGSPINIKGFNEHFGTHMEVSPDDFIDIYKAKSAKEILKFLARPIPFCRYCRGIVETGIPWHHSQKDIKEWTL